MLSVDETVEMLATKAEEEGIAPFISGTLYVEAEYYRGAVIWTADHRRVTVDQVRVMIEAARLQRSKLNIS